MTGSAQRPEKPESRDGCVSRMLSLQLQKSPTPDFEEKCGNSPDISKGISQLGIYKFESSEVSQAVQGLAIVCNLRLTGPEIPAFLAFGFVSRLRISRSQGRNGRKSPALSAKTPVLKRLLAETGSIILPPSCAASNNG